MNVKATISTSRLDSKRVSRGERSVVGDWVSGLNTTVAITDYRKTISIGSKQKCEKLILKLLFFK